MNEKPYGVHVIVDPAFGDRLREITTGEPIWIVDTPTNRLVYEAVGQERNPESYLVGLSSFQVDLDRQPEEWLISELETIDLHHGEMSHEPPWSLINVIGVKWTERIGEQLGLIGFGNHQETPEGFTAIKESANKIFQRTHEDARR